VTVARGRVQTVRGPIDPADLGWVLPHEHTAIALWHIQNRWDYWELRRDEPVPPGDRGARLAVDRAPEDLGGVGHADEARARHLEDAELVRRAEAVLHRAQDAVRVVAVTLELQHAVDEVLQDAWACNRAVLRHVADENGCDPAPLRHAKEARRSGRSVKALVRVSASDASGNSRLLMAGIVLR